MMSAKKSGKASLLAQCFEYLKPVDELEVFVSRLNKGLCPSLGLAMARNPEITWSNCRLRALRMANGLQWAKIPQTDHASLPERGEVTKHCAPSPVYNYSELLHSIISYLVSGRGIRHMTWRITRLSGSIAGRHHQK